MAFLRTTRPEEDLEVVRGRDVTLRQPQALDYAQWAELRALSRSHLVPWEPTWGPDDLSRSMFRRRLRVYAKDIREDSSYPYFIFNGATLIGGLTLSNVRRGSAQTASLGYWMGAPYAGRGHMQDAVTAFLRVAFGQLGLHRVEAATMLKNAASIRVLESCGFENEGLARDYLKINGRWEDHLLYAHVAGRPAAQARRDGGGG
ncbi:GNAT family N-acetyltransferase [Hyphomicrobium methylovorum]|uniref:GNAT family N-acetyltransferase n=1 Tax=Hyphomicrobium methylovorum TaxID=84 RepID=UPI0015E6DF4D